MNQAVPWGRLAGAFGLSLAVGLVGWWVLGMSLSLPLWMLAGLAIILPPLVAGTRRDDRVFIAMSVNDGMGFALLLAMYDASLSLWTWLLAYLVLASLTATMFAALTLARGRLGSAIVSVLALAWLGWPILLAAAAGGFAEGLATWLVPIHPPMAINGLLRDLGTWTHQPMSYRLMSLGQDTPYTLPTSVWPCVFAHLSLGALLLGVSWVLGRRRGPESGSAADETISPRP